MSTSTPVAAKAAASLTCYAFAAQVNKRREIEGLEGKIPAQMIYNYAKKGYIARNAQGLLDQVAANAWLEKYIARAKAKAAQA